VGVFDHVALGCLEFPLIDVESDDAGKSQERSSMAGTANPSAVSCR
jgi:hypothetical protein